MILGKEPRRWRKSTHSEADKACVEVALDAGRALVRDSKHPDLPHLALAPAAWFALLAYARSR
jgi:hypothetical protein